MIRSAATAVLFASILALSACGDKEASATPIESVEPTVEETTEPPPENTAGEILGTADFDVETPDGFAASVQVKWYKLREVESNVDLVEGCDEPGLSDPATVARAMRLEVTSTNTSGGSFEWTGPMQWFFEQPDATISDADPPMWCPGYATNSLDMIAGEPYGIDLIWFGVKSPNHPTGVFAADLGMDINWTFYHSKTCEASGGLEASENDGCTISPK